MTALRPSSALAQTTTLRIGTIPIDPAFECFYAQDRGTFKAAGIDASIQPLSSGGAVAAAIAGGAIDVGNVDLVTIAAAHSRGVPFVILAAAGEFTPIAPTYVLLVPKSSPIVSARDFSGKTVAVNGLKNINQIPTQAWIDNNGGDSRSVKFVEMPFPSMLPALRNGQIDAAAVTEPTWSASGDEFRVISLTRKNLAPWFLVAGWVALRPWVDAHRDLAQRFAGAMRDTARWANVAHAATAAMLSQTSKLPIAVAERMHRAYYGESLSPALIQPVIDAAARYGVIEQRFPARDLLL